MGIFAVDVEGINVIFLMSTFSVLEVARFSKVYYANFEGCLSILTA